MSNKTTHQIGDRVKVLHNIPLGNLIGTIKAMHARPTYDVYEVDLDGGGTDLLYGDQLEPLASESQREAAGTADEKPDCQAENKLLDHP